MRPGREPYLTSVIAGTEEEDPMKGPYFGGNRETPPDDERGGKTNATR
jgi:hypothetical protein